MEERRRAGTHLLRRTKLTKAAIARRLSVSRAAVGMWAKDLAAGGLRQLYQRRSTGRPCKLSDEQLDVLDEILERGALAAGIPTARWTLARVKRVVEREFAVTYHLTHMPRLLQRLGWMLQQPLAQAVEREEDVIQAWLTHDWPRIKKARRHGVDIVFFDEFGCSFMDRLRRTWASRGHRPVIQRVTSDRRMLTAAVGLTLSGHIYTGYCEGGMKSRDVIIFLKHLLRYKPEGFVLICDHASIHTSTETLRFLFEYPEILVEPLPKYAPELNPEDGFAVSWQRESPTRQRHTLQCPGDAPDAGSRLLPIAPQT